jgi:hypothetical protein
MGQTRLSSPPITVGPPSVAEVLDPGGARQLSLCRREHCRLIGSLSAQRTRVDPGAVDQALVWAHDDIAASATSAARRLSRSCSRLLPVSAAAASNAARASSYRPSLCNRYLERSAADDEALGLSESVGIDSAGEGRVMPKAYSSDLRRAVDRNGCLGDVGDRHGSRVWRQHLRTLVETCCYLIRRKDLQ